MVRVILFGVLFGFSAHAHWNLCEQKVLSSPWPRNLSATEAEIAQWQSNPELSAIASEVGSVVSFVKSAPSEVIYLLLLASSGNVSAHDAQAVAHLKRHFRKSKSFGTLELLLGHDLEEASFNMAALLYVERWATPEAKSYLRPILRSPTRLFILAASLLDFVPGQHLPALLNSLNRGIPPEIPLRARLLLGEKQTLSTMAYSNPTMMAFTVGAILQIQDISHNVRIAQVPKKMRSYKTNRIVLAYKSKHDREDRVEWIVDQLLGKPTAIVPDSDFFDDLKYVRKILIQPVNLAQKIPSHNYTVGDLTLLSILSEISDTITAFITQKYDPANTELTQFFLQIISMAFDQKVISPGPGLGALFGSFVFKGFKVVTVLEYKAQVPAMIAANFMQNLRQYEAPSQNPKDIEVVSTQEIPEIPVESISESSIPTAPDAVTTDIVGTLGDFVEGRRDIGELSPDETYTIVFRRGNGRFPGPQKVRFTRQLLDELKDFETKEVQPMSWLKALSMGTAAAHGERGIKFLNQSGESRSNGIPIEIKLLLTPIRVLGHYRDGVFQFESMANNHD